MRTPHTALFAAAFSILLAPARAQTPDRARIDRLVSVAPVSVIGDHPSGAFIRVKVQIRNIGTQPIYAFSLPITVRYSDGRTFTRPGNVDLLAAYLYAAAPGGRPSSQLLRPGDIYDYTNELPPGRNGAKPTSFTASIDMLILEDRTALGSRAEIDRTVKSRLRRAIDEETVAADLRKALRAPDLKAALDAQYKVVAAALQTSGENSNTDPAQYHAYQTRADRLHALAFTHASDPQGLAHLADFFASLAPSFRQGAVLK